MKLKSLSVLALSIVMSLPIHAQIYLDSTEIAKVLNPKQLSYSLRRLLKTVIQMKKQIVLSPHLPLTVTCHGRKTSRLDLMVSSTPHYFRPYKQVL